MKLSVGTTPEGTLKAIRALRSPSGRLEDLLPDEALAYLQRQTGHYLHQVGHSQWDEVSAQILEALHDAVLKLNKAHGRVTAGSLRTEDRLRGRNSTVSNPMEVLLAAASTVRLQDPTYRVERTSYGPDGRTGDVALRRAGAAEGSWAAYLEAKFVSLCKRNGSGPLGGTINGVRLSVPGMTLEELLEHGPVDSRLLVVLMTRPKEWETGHYDGPLRFNACTERRLVQERIASGRKKVGRNPDLRQSTFKVRYEEGGNGVGRALREEYTLTEVVDLFLSLPRG